MSYQIERQAVRQAVRDAIKLYRGNLINQDVLYEVAVSALSWEFSVGLATKTQKKQKKLERRLDNRR